MLLFQLQKLVKKLTYSRGRGTPQNDRARGGRAGHRGGGRGGQYRGWGEEAANIEAGGEEAANIEAGGKEAANIEAGEVTGAVVEEEEEGTNILIYIFKNLKNKKYSIF